MLQRPQAGSMGKTDFCLVGERWLEPSFPSANLRKPGRSAPAVQGFGDRRTGAAEGNWRTVSKRRSVGSLLTNPFLSDFSLTSLRRLVRSVLTLCRRAAREK